MKKTGTIIFLTLFFANAFAKEEVYFVKQDTVALTKEDKEITGHSIAVSL